MTAEHAGVGSGSPRQSPADGRPTLPSVIENLTDVEKRLVRAVETGGILDLRPPSAPDLPMDEWGEERTVRADLIRDLLLLRHAKSYDPHGLQLRGVRITGHLDLRNVRSPI